MYVPPVASYVGHVQDTPDLLVWKSVESPRHVRVRIPAGKLRFRVSQIVVENQMVVEKTVRKTVLEKVKGTAYF